MERGLLEPQPGSPEMSQPSARLPARGATAGVAGSPREPGSGRGWSAGSASGTPGASAGPAPPRWPAGPARAHRAARCPRSSAQRARGGSMPFLPLLAAPRFPVHRHCRALRLTSASRAEPPLSTERVPAGRGALLRPWGRGS